MAETAPVFLSLPRESARLHSARLTIGIAAGGALVTAPPSDNAPVPLSARCQISQCEEGLSGESHRVVQVGATGIVFPGARVTRFERQLPDHNGIVPLPLNVGASRYAESMTESAV